MNALKRCKANFHSTLQEFDFIGTIIKETMKVTMTLLILLLNDTDRNQEVQQRLRIKYENV